MPIVYNLYTMIIQFGKAFNVHFYKKGHDIVIQNKMYCIFYSYYFFS